jgi:hypothetical protein
MEWVSVRFKVAYTTDVIFYNIPIKWSITRFVTKVHLWILTDFGHLNEYASTLLVEMGQEIQGVRPEEAPYLTPDANLTYQDKFIANGKWPSFYVCVRS